MLSRLGRSWQESLTRGHRELVIEMAEFIFTFGVGHPLKKYYVAIKAPTAARCRELMIEQFGTEWSMQYETKEQAGVDQYGLKEIEIVEL